MGTISSATQRNWVVLGLQVQSTDKGEKLQTLALLQHQKAAKDLENNTPSDAHGTGELQLRTEDAQPAALPPSPLSPQWSWKRSNLSGAVAQ